MSAIIRREVFAGPTKDAEGVEREGALEAFALPGGNYVVALNRPAVLTDSGRIEAPGSLRFPVLTIGTPRGRCIAGQSQDSGATWEWVDAETRWSDRGPNAGERPCVYMADGTLIIEPGGQDHPTEGWAGLNPDGFPQRIVRYDQARDIHERTILGPLVIGQSSIDGIEIQFDGHRYQAEPGDTHTIWAVLQGNVLALATRKLAQNETVLIWVDINRLAELPPAPVKDDDGGGDHDDDDNDSGDDPMEKQAGNHLGIVAAVIAQYGGRYSPTDDDKRGTLVDIAVHRIRNSKDIPNAKRYGRKLKGDGHTLNTDTITYDRQDGYFEIYDVIRGNPDPSGSYAAWGDAEGGPIFKNGANGTWAPPQLADDAPEPDVDDDDDDGGHDDGLEARVKVLEAFVAGIQSALADGAEVNEQQWSVIKGQGDAITDLQNKPGGTVDLSGYAKKGDPVTVRGRIPILGNVTVRGEIDA